jgi:hypothetical protein
MPCEDWWDENKSTFLGRTQVSRTRKLGITPQVSVFLLTSTGAQR